MPALVEPPRVERRRWRGLREWGRSRGLPHRPEAPLPIVFKNCSRFYMAGFCFTRPPNTRPPPAGARSHAAPLGGSAVAPRASAAPAAQLGGAGVRGRASDTARASRLARAVRGGGAVAAAARRGRRGCLGTAQAVELEQRGGAFGQDQGIGRPDRLAHPARGSAADRCPQGERAPRQPDAAPPVPLRAPRSTPAASAARAPPAAGAP